MCVSQSTVCEKIMELLGQNEVDHRQRKLVILSQDRFYKVLTAEQKAKALKGQYNFDHPGRGSESWEGVGEKGRPLRLGPELAVDGEVAPGGPWLNLCGADWGLSPGSLLCALGLAGAPGSIGWSRSGSLQLRRVFRPTALPQLWSWRNLNAFMLSGACYADCFHWGRVLERPAVGEREPEALKLPFLVWSGARGTGGEGVGEGDSHAAPPCC